MGKLVGVMLTWVTYGSWLQGDGRGYVKDGCLLGANKKLERYSRTNLKKEAVVLSVEGREIVEDAIIREAGRIGERVFAIAVCERHVHMVGSCDVNEVSVLASCYKVAGAKGLYGVGMNGRVWAKGYDKRYCYSEGELLARVGYVEGHKR